MRRTGNPEIGLQAGEDCPQGCRYPPIRVCDRKGKSMGVSGCRVGVLSQNHSPHHPRLYYFQRLEDIPGRWQNLNTCSDKLIHFFCGCRCRSRAEETQGSPFGGFDAVNSRAVGNRCTGRFFKSIFQRLFSWCVTSSGIRVQDMVFDLSGSAPGAYSSGIEGKR